MEIGFKHWFSTFSVALLIHMFAVMNVNLTGASAESVHPFTQYVVDLTTLAPPPTKTTCTSTPETCKAKTQTDPQTGTGKTQAPETTKGGRT